MKILNFIVTILLVFPYFLISQQKTEINQALMIIDVQEFYFPGGFNPLFEPDAASKQAAILLNEFRAKNKLIVHIKHATNKDSLIHQYVQPQNGEKVIRKQQVNSYLDTDLLKYLKQHNINQVVICGMMTHMCVEAAARASSDFGFDVVVIDDACATKDIIYRNDTVSAANVHTSTLGSINRYYGKVMTTADFLNN